MRRADKRVHVFPNKHVYLCMPAISKEEPFDLTIQYNDQLKLLPAKFVQRGYSWKIYVDIDGQEVIFEPDEERNFRAVTENISGKENVRMDMIERIVSTLQEYFR